MLPTPKAPISWGILFVGCSGLQEIYTILYKQEQPELNKNQRKDVEQENCKFSGIRLWTCA